MQELAKFDFARSLDWSNPRLYGQFLAQTYYYVCHSTRLLAASAARIGIEREKLHHRFLKHAAEERSHHVLAERDLTQLGMTLSDFPELATTQALYESQYFRVEHKHPLCLFGYILTLEGVTVLHGPWLYEKTRAAHGDDATGFLRLHAKEDADHLGEGFAMIGTLTEHEQSLVLDNVRFSAALYDVFLRSLARATFGDANARSVAAE
jgi:hypothetical protein